jgi:hypothetical protein
MERQNRAPLAEAQLKEFDALFGSPPVLSTEDPKLFQGILEQVMAAIQCEDGIVLLLVRHFVYASWKLERYIRHDTIAIERRYRQQLEFQAKRITDQHALREAKKRELAEAATSAPQDIAYLIDLERKAMDATSEVCRALKQTASEIDHNLALEKSAEFREHLDRLIQSETKQRNDALRQIELYRAGLGESVSAAAKQIIDAEFEEIPAKPPVAKSTPKKIEPPAPELDDDDFQEFNDWPVRLPGVLPT